MFFWKTNSTVLLIFHVINEKMFHHTFNIRVLNETIFPPYSFILVCSFIREFRVLKAETSADSNSLSLTGEFWNILRLCHPSILTTVLYYTVLSGSLLGVILVSCWSIYMVWSLNCLQLWKNKRLKLVIPRYFHSL